MLLLESRYNYIFYDNMVINNKERTMASTKAYRQEKVTISELWKLAMIKNYTNFSGRATRREYWFVTLINIFTFIVLYIVAIIVLGVEPNDTDPDGLINYLPLVGLVIIGIAAILPTLALEVRRLHDSNRRGWWMLIRLIPIVGDILMLVFTLSKGNDGKNDYGPPAKFVG